MLRGLCLVLLTNHVAVDDQPTSVEREPAVVYNDLIYDSDIIE
ncbi:hypothetical protein [Vineibacter terrae]|nr:hypothetical protein [Vineibacter terrae]